MRKRGRVYNGRIKASLLYADINPSLRFPFFGPHIAHSTQCPETSYSSRKRFAHPLPSFTLLTHLSRHWILRDTPSHRSQDFFSRA